MVNDLFTSTTNQNGLGKWTGTGNMHKLAYIWTVVRMNQKWTIVTAILLASLLDECLARYYQLHEAHRGLHYWT